MISPSSCRRTVAQYGRGVDFFVNTEFIDLDRRIDLISLGIVAADGRELYAISTEFDPGPANDFVRGVVLPLLEPRDHPAWMSRAAMRSALLDFVGDEAPTFWSWGAATWDLVGLNELLPLSERVPEGWRYTCFDVSMLAEGLGLRVDPVDPSLPAPPSDVHHALADARWVRDVHAWITPRLSGPRWPAVNPDPAASDYFVDTEFIETEHEVDLVSLAVVAADGRELYAVSTEFDPTRANDFVATMVLPRLEPVGDPCRLSRPEIRAALLAFVGTGTPRFWAWGGAPYDHLMIARLFAPAERMPGRWRYTAYDIAALAEPAGDAPDPPADAHHALTDARWAREAFRHLTGSR